MKQQEFVDRLCKFALAHLAPKCHSPMTLMAIGAASCGAGRRLVERKAGPLLALATDENGDIDVAGIRESVMGGFALAQSVPVLGGLFSLDEGDARAFFDSLG